MKKKILLIISMFLFITNVNALTFNVDLTNIEDKGNNGTIGSIERIDVANKELDVLFQDIGDEVNFELTVSNTGDRAGTLRSINITSSNDKIIYTHNLPEGGLAINGNDTNKVLINAKVQAGATKGKTTSEIKLTYNYDEGSCPEGEILSDDESMCLCPEGTERNEIGICVVPEKKIECKDDEIYNETKKICEKKVIPVPDKTTPSNPKTMDNIVLITLLFFVSGLGIYAVLFKKLNTNKKKITAAVITGVTTLTLSFTVLAGVFGLDNLLGAIVNPITKSKEITITVNETIDLIVTWDGDCDVTGVLTPSNVFDGGSGTESDPYQIKTANQLAYFAKSVNEGETYEGKFIKQTKNIKLNDNLNEQAEAGDLSSANVWTSAGYMYYDSNAGANVIKTFSGIYDGDDHTISGLYILDSTNPASGGYKGMFGHTTNATFKNMVLSDVYMETNGFTGSLIGYALGSLNIGDITTYGKGKFNDSWGAGLVSYYDGNGSNESSIVLENIENNINLDNTSTASGVIHRISSLPNSDEPNVIIRNVTNNGSLSFLGSIAGGIIGEISTSANVLIDNAVNTGNILQGNGSQYGGIVGALSCTNATITNSHNSGNWSQANVQSSGGLVGYAGCVITFDNVYNSGNMIDERFLDYEGDGSSYTLGSRTDIGGIIGLNSRKTMVYNSFNTGDFIGSYAYTGGIVGRVQTDEHSLVENCYNTGYIKGYGYNGGLVGSLTGDINKSYNKGNIHVFGGPRAGGLAGWGGNGSWNPVNIYNSYNEGNIVTSSQSGQHAGLCAADCGVIKNSYNRGNLIVKYYASDIGGITAQSGTISNVYNSGQIIFENDGPGYMPYAGGISSSPSTKVTNSYNLGDITVHQNGYSPGYRISGISSSTNAENCVNTGNLLVKYTRPVVPSYNVYIAGITFNGSATNCFNAGKIDIDETGLETPLTEDERNRIAIGQISFAQSGSGNKWNTDPNGHASGCLGNSNNCSLEGDQATGTYTTEDAPDILSIINGDGAFNDELDEYGLPTLKAFNE